MPRRTSTLLAFSLLAAPIALLAQAPSASVVGRITDSSGAVVPGVSLKISNSATNLTQSTVSNHSGDYTLPFLPPGTWSLQAAAEGFSTYQHAAFTLAVDQEQRIDIRLELGTSSQTVTVADTPEALQTETGSRGEVTTNAEITQLPLNGRNYTDLAFQTAGVVPRGEGADGQFAVNGARADNISLMIDGMNNTQRRNTTSMVSPPLESVQEFKLITSGFSAEYGRFSGGVLSMVTKSGANRVHGALYDFLRNDALDARNFFSLTKPKLIQNQFGAAISGPVRIPSIYDGRDRTFFVFGWESQRTLGESTTRGTVPTAAMLAGDFSRATDALGKPEIITDPLAKSPFAGNRIPASRLDPVARSIGAFYPASNLAGLANNYIVQARSLNDYNKFNARADHSVGTHDRFTFSTLWNRSDSLNPFQRSPVAIFGGTTDNFGLLAGVRWIHTFTPNVIGEASANFSRNTFRQLNIGSDHDWSADAGFNGATKDPINLGLPFVSVSGYIDLGQAYDLPKIWSYNNFQYSGAITWIRGAHTFKFGGDFLHYQYFNHDYADLRGRLTFLGRFTSDPVADFVLGYAQTSRRLAQVGTEYLLVSNYSAFLQDDFKITPRLTINAGLRYELMKQPAEKYDARSAFVPELGKIVLAGRGILSQSAFNAALQSTGLSQFAMASDVGLPRTIVKTNYRDFAPRFGFAWRPFGDTKTVLRGGYGIFFGTDSLYRYDGFSDTFPFLNTLTFNASPANPLALTVSNPFPDALAKTAGVATTSALPPNNPTQYLQTWNLTVEHDLGRGTVLELGYSASKGTHLPRAYNLNQQPIYPGAGVGPRPYPAFTTITIFADQSNSTYQSGSATLRRRLNRKMFVRASYSFAKSLDFTSNTGGVVAGNFPSAQNSYDLAQERGRSDFDVRQSFLSSFIWAPELARGSFLTRWLLKGWQISGTATAYSGSPFTPKLANFDITTGGAARPDRVATGTLAKPSPDAWFDRAAFPSVPLKAFRFGTSGRNVLDGPGTFSLNTGLSRTFPYRETLRAQFRLEAFNVTNHANFNLPNTQVDTISGATITAAKNPRQIQVAIRLSF